MVKTGVDAETLRNLERRVQEAFVDGLPPHLLPSARSLAYMPKSNQSRLFVAPHSEYINLTPQQILGVFRERHILIHGHPFDHEYGWNLESFARLYDVDRPTTVHGEMNFKSIIIILTTVSKLLTGWTNQTLKSAISRAPSARCFRSQPSSQVKLVLHSMPSPYLRHSGTS